MIFCYVLFLSHKGDPDILTMTYSAGFPISVCVCPNVHSPFRGFHLWGLGGGTDSVNPTIPCPLFFRAEKNHLKALFAHSSPILAPHPCHPFIQREGRRPWKGHSGQVTFLKLLCCFNFAWAIKMSAVIDDNGHVINVLRSGVCALSWLNVCLHCFWMH